jgi:CRP-like cAMP-binding protein
MRPNHSLWASIVRKRNHDAERTGALLKQVPLFAGLRKCELRDVERLVHRRLYKDGEVVFWEGEPGVGMYIVQQGEVSIYKEYGKRGQRELARLQSGDFFGEMALLEGDCRSATAVARGDACLFGLIHPDLFHLFRRKPQLGVKLLAALADVLARRLRLTNQELQRLSLDALVVETEGESAP